MQSTLVIFPCGKAKIWDNDPRRGPTPARNAYTGAPFTINRAYAERFGDEWVVLSAKYGFIRPEYVIPGSYNTTFKRRTSDVVSHKQLREQIDDQKLAAHSHVIGLGGKEYRDIVVQAFAGYEVALRFPFAGLGLGRSMQAVKLATIMDDPYFSNLPDEY